MMTLHLLLGLVATRDLELIQMDVKTIFLHEDLEQEMYMEQLEGYAKRGKEHLVCKLRKNIYELKQAPR